MKYSKIFVIGDSHTGTLHGKFSHIDVFPMGPITMYDTINGFMEKIIELLKSQERISDIGLYVFSAGEIDARCLIYNQIHEKGRQEDEVINTLVDGYVKKIKTLFTDVAILSLPPPVNFFTGGYEKEINCLNYPFIGPDEDRNRYVFKINKRLEEKCSEYDIIYLNIYDSYKNEQGYLIKEFSDGNVHIARGGNIDEILKNLELA